MKGPASFLAACVRGSGEQCAYWLITRTIRPERESATLYDDMCLKPNSSDWHLRSISAFSMP